MRQMRRWRVGVAEPFEVTDDVGGSGTASPGVGEQRQAVGSAVPLHARHNFDPSLDERELAEHSGRVDRRPRAVGDQELRDRPVADM